MALVGWVEDPNGCPYLDGHVTTRDAARTKRITFLLDTGADTSFLMPGDAHALGIDLGGLAMAPESTTGIGGEARYYQTEALLTFSDREHLYLYEVDLEIAVPTEHNRGLPSLLGRDILSRWLLRYEAPRSVVAAEVNSADMVIRREQ